MYPANLFQQPAAAAASHSANQQASSQGPGPGQQVDDIISTYKALVTLDFEQTKFLWTLQWL